MIVCISGHCCLHHIHCLVGKVEFCDPHGLLYFADYAPKVTGCHSPRMTDCRHIVVYSALFSAEMLGASTDTPGPKAFRKLREAVGVDEEHYYVSCII